MRIPFSFMILKNASADNNPVQNFLNLPSDLKEKANFRVGMGNIQWMFSGALEISSEDVV